MIITDLVYLGSATSDTERYLLRWPNRVYRVIWVSGEWAGIEWTGIAEPWGVWQVRRQSLIPA